MSNDLGTPSGRGEAGRELDAEVAEKVFGKQVRRDRNGEAVQFYGDYPSAGFFSTPKPYSTEMHAAWPVVRAMEKRVGQWLFRMTALDYSDGGPLRYEVEFRECAEPWGFAVASASSAPLAICLAALKAVATPHAAGVPKSPNAV